jgi:uncharacterized SAM-binding protein YcdF (DUF218 family)
VFVACLGLLAVAHRPLFSGMARWLDVGEPPTRVDYVVALPGDMNTRPLVAAAMVRTGMARQVIVPHTQPGAEVEQKLEPAHGNLLETILKGRGVPADAILLIDSRSNSTFDDAQAVASFLRDRPRASLAIVTNDYHTRRARDIFRTALAGLPVELHVVSAPTDGFAADDWWETRTGFQAYANEFGKVLSYWLYYGHGLYWLGAAAVVFAAWRLIAARRVRASAQ